MDISVMSVTRRDGQTQARQHDNASGRPYVTERLPTTDGAKAKRLQSIDRFYASSKPGRDKNPPNLATLRVAELGHLFSDRYGRGGQDYVLPDDDSGRDDAYLMCCHLANCPDAPEGIRRAWLRAHAPWLSKDERNGLLARPALKWSADKLAERIGLTFQERQRLHIRTIGAIDMNKEQRAARRSALNRKAHMAARRANGAIPRAQYLAESTSGNRPWEAEGISRRTWYRRRARQDGTSASAVFKSEASYCGRTCATWLADAPSMLADETPVAGGELTGELYAAEAPNGWPSGESNGFWITPSSRRFGATRWRVLRCGSGWCRTPGVIAGYRWSLDAETTPV